MANKLKEAFESIRADEALKTKTFIYLQGEMQRKKRTVKTRRFFTAVACLLCISMVGFFSHSLYFTKSAYIDLDINPAIELTMNRFDRVIDIYAYNEDGEKVIEDLQILHKTYNEVVSVLLEAIVQKGYVAQDGFLSVTLQMDDADKEDKVLADIRLSAEAIIKAYYESVEVDVFSVTSELRSDSYEQNISPAKYLAILDLQQTDPEITVESCRHHSISEIKSLTDHHNTQDSDSQSVETETNNNMRHHGGGHHRQGHGGRR